MNNKPVTLPFLPKTKAVVGFYIRDGKILLGKRKHSGTNLGVGLVAGIGGKVEKGESFNDALVREFREEINAIPIQFHEVGTAYFIFEHKPKESKWNMKVKIFKVIKIKGEIKETADIMPTFYKTNSIPYNLMWPDNRYWLDFVINDTKFYVEAIYANDTILREIYLKMLD